MSARRVTPFALVLLIAAGCQGNVVDSGGLSLVESDRGIAGTFEGERAVVDFAAAVVDANVLELTIELNGLMITALADADRGIIEQDAFAVENGADTQVLEEDRKALEDFSNALAGVADRPDPLEKLMLFAAVLTQHPETVEPTQILFLDESRRTTLCHKEYQFTPASHDCDSGGWWTDKTTLDYAYVSAHPDVCGGSWDGTAFYVPWGGTFRACKSKTLFGVGWCDSYNVSIPYAGWWCYESNHDVNVEHAYGNCLSNCGSGCSGGGRNFTQDCLNHDQCVRNGHITASGYCDDQYVSAMDDWFGSSCPQ